MSKTFKSAYAEHGDQKLNIIGVDDGVRVSADHGSHGAKGIIIATSDAPALALAILEAAGFTEESPNFGTAVHELELAIKEQDCITAEAEAQAKLEAEALELAKAGCEAVGDESAQKLSDMTYKDQRFFLAIARSAREINKEEQ